MQTAYVLDENNWRSVSCVSGNEVGTLIGDELLRKKCQGDGDLVATRCIKSIIRKLATQYGADYRRL